MAVTSAHCAKTLVMASAHGSHALGRCAKLLLPGMIEGIAKVAAMDSGEISDMQVQVVGEIFKAFDALFSSTGESQSEYQPLPGQNIDIDDVLGPRLLGVLLPVMTMVLNPAHAPPSKVHTQTIAQVLKFAASSPAAFKEATSKLPNDMKETLETSVRQALGGSKTTASESHKPQISLRSF
jgi:HEAT repeat-containing protein 5